MKFKISLYIGFLFITTSLFSINKIEEWGNTGHRTIGEIAEKYLTKKAKRNINKLLQCKSLAFVSTWADEIKSDKKFRKFYPWHYVNMELNQTYETSEKNPKGDLVTAINNCIKVLKNKNSTIKNKRFYLKMLVHFIGDLHQPLHIGRKKDKGGNTIQLRWFNHGTNLHKVWDSNMIKKWNMSYSELAKNTKHLSKNQIKQIEKGTIIDWVNQVHQLTKKIYASVKTGENLMYKYNYKYFPILREQLQKGGIRLAKILNKIFG